MNKWQPIETAPFVTEDEMWRALSVFTCVRGSDGLPRTVQTNRQVEGYGWLKKDDWTHWVELPVEFEESSDE